MSDTPDTPDTPDTGDTPDTPDTGFVVTHTTRIAPNMPARQPAAAQVRPTVAAGMVLGVDSLVPSGAALLGHAQSADFLGQAPQFWGRYFYAPGQKNAAGMRDTHYSAAENAMLRANNIRVLPIARQTAHVGGTAIQGQADAKANVDAIYEVFSPAYLAGADPDVLVFLDVEADISLSADYYKGWSEALEQRAADLSGNRVRFRPAVYGSAKANATWEALNTAIASGCVCHGLWIARYFFGSPKPRPWDDHLVTPLTPPPCPVLAWQYFESPNHAPEAFNFDTNLASPAHADALLAGLVMPPAG